MVPVLIGTVACGVIGGGGFYLLYPTLFPQPETAAPRPEARAEPPQAPRTPQVPPAENQQAALPVTPPATKPPVEPEIARPTPAAIQTELQSVLGRYDCAGLTAQVGDDLHATVTGFAQSSDLPKLRAAVASIGQGVSVSTDAVAGYVWPHCALVKLLGPAPVGSASAPRIALNNPSGKYHNNDPFRITVTAPAAGYLQLDYYDSSGSVSHVDWGKVAAGERKELTDTIGRPFGPNMMVALFSPQRLFAAARPAQEDAHGYLAELQGRIQTGSVQDNYVMFDSAP
jgi:hypothetical protein